MVVLRSLNTTTESIVSYTCHIVRDSDGGKVAAIKESTTTYTRHAVGDRCVLTTHYHCIGFCFNNTITIITRIIFRIPRFHVNRGQATAIRESILSNASHTARNRDRGQAGAKFKSPEFDARHAIGDCDGG